MGALEVVRGGRASTSIRLPRLVRRRLVLEVVETEAVSGSSLLGEKRNLD